MRALLLPALLAHTCTLAAAEPPLLPFADGAQVVFFGDSITHGGSYHAWVQLFHATRFPDRRIRCLNAGIGGTTAKGSLVRLEEDVLARKPDAVVVLFGMNDVNRGLYKNAAPDTAGNLARQRALTGYGAAMDTLLGRLAAPGRAVVVATPTPYDQYHALKTENFASCNDGLAGIAAVARTTATAHGCALVDLHAPMTALLRDTPDWMPAQDRVHPDAVGHFVVAYVMLKALGASGTVARASIDAAAGKAGICDNCTIDGLTATGGGLTFSYAARALPFPTSPEFIKAAALVPWAELNREVLRVSGLKAGDHRLRLDGLEIGIYSAAAFAAGIELSGLDTPQQRQAGRILAAVRAKIAADAPLRSVAKIEDLLRQHGRSGLDRAATDAFLDDFAAKSPSKGYYQWEIGNYRKARDNAAANSAALDNAFAAIHAAQVVAPIRVEITPVR